MNKMIDNLDQNCEKIVSLMAKLLASRFPDFNLAHQEAEFTALPCIEPHLGRLLDKHGVECTISAILEYEENSETEISAVELSEIDRVNAVEMVLKHVDDCPHCRSRREAELELDEKVRIACSENRDLFRDSLPKITPPLVLVAGAGGGTKTSSMHPPNSANSSSRSSRVHDGKQN